MLRMMLWEILGSNQINIDESIQLMVYTLKSNCYLVFVTNLSLKMRVCVGVEMYTF